MQTINGKGKVFRNNQPLSEGKYRINRDARPDRQTTLSGTFEIVEENPSRLVQIFETLKPTPDLVLEIETGRRFDVTLTVEIYDFPSGMAQFKILFMPGKNSDL